MEYSLCYFDEAMREINTPEEAEQEFEERIRNEVKKNNSESRANMYNYISSKIGDKEMFNNPQLNTSKMGLGVDYKTKQDIWKFDDMAKDLAKKSENNSFLVKIKRMITDKPRNFIAKVAARLREVYRKWLLKANYEKDNKKLKWYKNILRVILKGIDFVMRKLEGLKVNYTARHMKALKLDPNNDIDNFKYKMNMFSKPVKIDMNKVKQWTDDQLNRRLIK